MIYILAEGYYSDYHIITASTDKSVITKIQKFFPNSEIEEWEEGEIFLNLKLYYIKSDALGNVISCEEDQIAEYDTLERDETIRHYRNSHAMRCWAKDEEHAKKIFHDEFARYEAEREGII